MKSTSSVDEVFKEDNEIEREESVEDGEEIKKERDEEEEKMDLRNAEDGVMVINRQDEGKEVRYMFACVCVECCYDLCCAV